MYKNQFDPILKKRDIPSSLLLFGDHFLIDLYHKRIKKAIQPDEVQLYYKFEYDFAKLRSTLSQSSLFGDRVLVVLKSEDKINGKELKSLVSSAEKSENIFFLYLFYGDDFKTQLTPFGNLKSVRFFEPNENDIRDFIHKQAKNFDIQLDRESENLLFQMSGGNLSLLNSELEKLRILKGERIDREALLKIVSIPASIGIDRGISDFLMSKNSSRFIAEYDEQEWDEIAVVSYMTKFVEEIFLFRSAMDLGEDISSIEVLGRKLPPVVEREKHQFAYKYRLKDIERILFILAKLEASLKSGGIGDKSSLFISEILRVVD